MMMMMIMMMMLLMMKMLHYENLSLKITLKNFMH